MTKLQTCQSNENWSWTNADCLYWLPSLESEKYKLVILDLPYGTTQNHWDVNIDLLVLWPLLERVMTKDGIVLAFAQQPFTTDLVVSNRQNFRYAWVWEKSHPSGFLNAKKQPMRAHEDVLVFCRQTPSYYPQMWDSGVRKTVRNRPVRNCPNYGQQQGVKSYDTTLRYPRSVISFPSDKQDKKLPKHPTRKPVGLLSTFIKTYTQPNEWVLDPTAGVASVGVAAINEGRRFDGCELNEEYYEGGLKRLYSVEKNG